MDLLADLPAGLLAGLLADHQVEGLTEDLTEKQEFPLQSFLSLREVFLYFGFLESLQQALLLCLSLLRPQSLQ